MIYAACIWAVAELLPGVFVVIFTNDLRLAEFARWAVSCIIYMAAVVLMGAQIACQQTFIAFGNSKISAFLAMFRKIIVLIPLIYPAGISGRQCTGSVPGCRTDRRRDRGCDNVSLVSEKTSKKYWRK